MNRGVAEWSIALVLKTNVPRGTGGSNPSASAKPDEVHQVFYVSIFKILQTDYGDQAIILGI